MKYKQVHKESMECWGESGEDTSFSSSLTLRFDRTDPTSPYALGRHVLGQGSVNEGFSNSYTVATLTRKQLTNIRDSMTMFLRETKDGT